MCPSGAGLNSYPFTTSTTFVDFTEWSEMIDGDHEFPVAEIVYRIFSCFYSYRKDA